MNAALQAPAASGQALQTIEGERKAEQYLARLRAEQTKPDELALIVAPLYGQVLRGFCHAIQRALEAGHA